MSTAAPHASLHGPTRGEVWQRVRLPLLLAGGIVVLALLGALLAGSSGRGALDPDSAGPQGTKALARLLSQDGVVLERTTSVDDAQSALAAQGTTLLVTFPDRVTAQDASALLGTGADVVLVEPTAPQQWVEGIDLRQGPGAEGPADGPPVRAPACDLPAATRAGAVEVGALSYTAERRAGEEVFLCYAAGGFASLVQVTDPDSDGRAVSVLGDATPLTNDRLDEEGNAALALGLLGNQPRLVWLLPPVTAGAGDAPADLLSLLPGQVGWVLAQLGVALLLTAAWRARRLGPVVPEPLPVVVRAAEATEGRARLYRRFRATRGAGESLREASRARLTRRLGLPRTAARHEVVTAAARHTTRHPGEVDALLYGAPAPDDATMVRLAGALDTLEREVGRP